MAAVTKALGGGGARGARGFWLGKSQHLFFFFFFCICQKPPSFERMRTRMWRCWGLAGALLRCGAAAASLGRCWGAGSLWRCCGAAVRRCCGAVPWCQWRCSLQLVGLLRRCCGLGAGPDSGASQVFEPPPQSMRTELSSKVFSSISPWGVRQSPGNRSRSRGAPGTEPFVALRAPS